MHNAAVVGIVLIGIATAVSAAPTLLQGAGLAVYYAEDTRQAFAADRFERKAPDLVLAAATLLTGLAVALKATPIANRLCPQPRADC